jgi:hypothetical protein
MSTAALTRDLIVAQTRALKLPGIARGFEALARQARDAHWPHEEYLHEILTAEQHSRHESVIRQRLHDARFPEVKTLDTFDFAAAASSPNACLSSDTTWVMALSVTATSGHNTVRMASLVTRADGCETRSLSKSRTLGGTVTISSSWLRRYAAVSRRNGPNR